MKLLLFLVTLMCWSLSTAIPVKDENNAANNSWAVLMAGSRDWDNYRHQADICHSYQLLIRNGFDPDRIIVLMFDDIANNELNYYKGQIFNEPNGKDVYHGVKIDYSGNDVTAETFLNILKGNKTGNKGKGSGRVLESSASDNIFIFYSSHGNFKVLGTPIGDYLYKNDLFEAFEVMNEKKMYKNLLFYLESCESGSMFLDLKQEWNIYAVTASSDTRNSYATYCSNSHGLPCLGDLFSVLWMKDSETHDIRVETVGTQFDELHQEITFSEVSDYGNRKIRSDAVALYQGSIVSRYDETECPDPITYNYGLDQVMDNQEVALITKEKIAYQKGFEKSQVFAIMQHYTKLRSSISDFMINIVKETVAKEEDIGQVLTAKLSKYSQNDCHQKALKAFNKCVPFGENTFAFRFSRVFANLCEILKSEKTIVQSLEQKCKNGPLFVGAV